LPLAQRAQSSSFGLRAEYTQSIRWFSLHLGLDLRGSHDRLARSGTLTLPAREGDIALFGQTPVDALARDAWRATQISAAPHLTLSFRVADLTIEPALRLENVLISVSRSVPTDSTVPRTGVDRFYTFLEPRLRVHYRVSAALSAEARAGIVHQAPSSADLSAVFGSPTLRAARAIHAAAGPRLTLSRDLTLELVGYYRHLSDLALRSERTPPGLAAALLAQGEGASYGASLSLGAAPARGLTVKGSYTLGRSTRREADGRERLFDRDQTHLLSLVFSYVAERWSSALGLRAASGRPRTPVIGSYYDATSGRMEPLFGQHNGARLPCYVQVNVHAELLLLRVPLRVRLLLDALNLTNRENVEAVAYDQNFSRRSDVTGLPFLAMLGLRLEY
jgi:hypothetical protein